MRPITGMNFPTERAAIRELKRRTECYDKAFAYVQSLRDSRTYQESVDARMIIDTLLRILDGSH